MKDAWLAPSAPRDPSCRGPPPGRPPCGGRPSDGPAPPGRPLRGRPLGGAPPGRPPSGGRPLGCAPPGRPPNGGRPLGGPAPPGRPRRGPGPTRSPSGPGGLCSRAPSPASWCRRSVGSPLGGVSLALTRGLLGYRGSLCFAEHHAPPEKQVRVIWYRLDIIVQIATKFDTIFYHAIRNLIAKRQVVTSRGSKVRAPGITAVSMPPAGGRVPEYGQAGPRRPIAACCAASSACPAPAGRVREARSGVPAYVAGRIRRTLRRMHARAHGCAAGGITPGFHRADPPLQDVGGSGRPIISPGAGTAPPPPYRQGTPHPGPPPAGLRRGGRTAWPAPEDLGPRPGGGPRIRPHRRRSSGYRRPRSWINIPAARSGHARQGSRG